MRLALVLAVVGRILRLFALVFAPPALLALVDGEGLRAVAYVVGGAVAAVAGWRLSLLAKPGASLLRSESLAIVSGTWLAIGVASAVPFLGEGLGPMDALFEAISGITTTGASVITDFGAFGRATFLWRSLLNWVGGLGVIALFVAVFPHLGIAGRQLFFAEASPAGGEAIATKVRGLVARLGLVYASLTAVEVGLLAWQGMPLFDAICNSMSTLSTGGFSPHPQSIGGYGLPACEWTVTAFMFLGGTSLALLWRALSGRVGALLRDTEFRVYATVAVLAGLATAVGLASGIPGEGELRSAFFQTTSVMTETGFATEDFNAWPHALRALLVGLMLFGGCAGSTAGGPKVVRYVVVARHTSREMVRVLHPQAVVPIRLGRVTVPDEVLRSVVTFVVVYLAAWAAVSLALLTQGLEPTTAVTASLSCLANCGPGLGSVGPASSYEHLPAVTKATLSFAMWIGRLEVVTVLALLRFDVLRGLRWRGPSAA